MNEDLRYPVGKLQEEGPLGAERRLELIEQIAETPERLRAAIHGLDHRQLDTPYRPGGWTVRQVIHHVPDSHLNAYLRFKLALTEETPTIKPYAEALWAALPDTGRTAPEVSLTLLDALHKRWVILLRAMGTPRQVFRQLPRAVMKFSSTSTMEILDVGSTSRISMVDRKSTRLNSSHGLLSRMPSSA